MERHEFEGVIGDYHWQSEPWWPPERRAPEGAPNVLLVILDDTGFAQLGCFGSDIATPTFDRLAAEGLRYSSFHTTALCSPTRACVLTGRNHHAVGMGRITDLAMGFPGYDARIPRSAAMLPRVLVDEGWAAYAVGKWHLTPEEDYSLGARRDRWPLGRGFERWYGFFGGESHQFAPALAHDNHYAEPPRSYEDGYHLTEDLADHAIEFVADLRNADGDKPFFLYFATGACHSPHQAPAAWVERYRGQFDDGWDVWRERTFERQKAAGLLPESTDLSPRPDWVPAWDTLTPDERRVFARYMEAFAGFLSHTDAQVGRVVDWLEQAGELENTLVIVMSDNGASSEGGPVGSLNDARAWNGLPRTLEEAVQRIDEIGGPRIHNNYPWGWTVAGNTPFRRWKRETHEGGIADPLIVHWPARVGAPGEVRGQYVHAIDILPTVLEVCGIDAPATVDGVEQLPIDGVSFAYTFDDASAADRHVTQYYEMFGCRALYHDGWKVVCFHDIQSDEPGLDAVRWELYDTRADPSECHDRAAAEPERLEAMVQRWWDEARRHGVLPLDNRPFSEFVLGRPPGAPERSRVVLWPDTGMIPEEAAPNVKNRRHTITASLTVADDAPAEGVICAQGSVLGGWSFHLVGGRLCYVHNLSGWREYRVEAPVALGAGAHELAFRYEPGGGREPGIASLVVDGDEVARGEIKRFTFSRFSLTNAGMTVGWAAGISAADRDYSGPFPLPSLDRVVFDLDGDPWLDPDAVVADAFSVQ